MSYYSSDQSGWYATDKDGAGSQGWDQSAYGGGGAQQQDYYAQSQSSYGQPHQQHAYGFMPSAQAFQAEQQRGGGPVNDAVDLENEPPLLEELGINFEHIRAKTFAVLNPLNRPSSEVSGDQDLAGPLVFCLLFGAALLMQGKIHFGYIYGIGVLGCLGMWSLLNLMSESGISGTLTVSVLGYCLLPMALLSLLAALASFKGGFGLGLAALAVVWCSASASKLFASALSLEHQALLVAYPCGLLYAVFALLAIF